jgi:hypothetical protein
VQLAHTQITAATAAATTTTTTTVAVAAAAAIAPCLSSALIYKQSSSMG